MIGFILKSVAMAFGIATGIFSFVPEAFFGKYEWVTQTTFEQYKWFAFCDVQDINIIISRLVCFLLVWIGTSLLYGAFLKFRRWTIIKGQNYSIKVEYGNILKKRKCKRVISFDECFTTQDLLNMMIWSYKLSSHKIKAPYKLRIVCKKNSGFSINNIDE